VFLIHTSFGQPLTLGDSRWV